jgi:hypothetical protein
MLLSGHFKNPVANEIFGLFQKFQLLCTTKDQLNTIGLGPVTFDYFSMEPTGLVIKKFENVFPTTMFFERVCLPRLLSG